MTPNQLERPPLWRNDHRNNRKTKETAKHATLSHRGKNRYLKWLHYSEVPLHSYCLNPK